jgi:hypothetical protein
MPTGERRHRPGILRQADRLRVDSAVHVTAAEAAWQRAHSLRQRRATGRSGIRLTAAARTSLLSAAGLTVLLELQDRLSVVGARWCWPPHRASRVGCSG